MAVTVLGTLPYGETNACSIAITTMGVTNYGTFTLTGSPNLRDHTVVFTATGATALPTTLTFDLECSPDGGTTWGKFATGIALIATTALTAKVVINMVSGLLYRINPTTYTAGSSTGTTVQATPA